MAKNLERIGDHTTNIAETLYFLVHGKPLAQIRPKRDRTVETTEPGDNGHQEDVA
jgi:phosphate transport system protein